MSIKKWFAKKTKDELAPKYEPIVFVNHPISKSEEDVIGFDSQVNTLLCAIENNANMIGIVADYGTGKSSMTELLVKSARSISSKEPIKINMWDCLSKNVNDSHESESVSALTKSFLYQLANGHSSKFARYINKVLSKNYGNISFSSNNNRHLIICFLITGVLFAIYKMLGISNTGVMQYIPDLHQIASFLKLTAPAFLLGALVFAFWGIKDACIAFSHWKMPSRREPELNDVYDTYALIAEKVISKKGKVLVFIDDLDRIDKKNLVVEFLKELYRFQDSLGKQKEKLVFIISLKPESQLESECEDKTLGNIYSKIFDITLSLKPIHFDDYDSLLMKLVDSNPNQKARLEHLLGHTLGRKVPKEFYWIKKGTNLTLRNMKDRLNQATNIMTSLKNKDYKVKTAAEFKSCAAVAYLENQHQKDYYELIQLEAEFSEFMQTTRLIIDDKTHTEKLPKIQQAFSTHFKGKSFSEKFIEDFCTMIAAGDFNDDYRMYFYTYPKGSPIKTTDERTLCDYILMPNSHNHHDKLDELVARIFENGENEIIKETIESLEEDYPAVLIENDTLFRLSVTISFNKTFSTFAKEIICSGYDKTYRMPYWTKLLALSKSQYDDFVAATIHEIIETCDEAESLLATRESIVLGIPEKVLDFKELYDGNVLDFAPQITPQEIEAINNIDVCLQLVDIENLEITDMKHIVAFLNSEELKESHPGGFEVACSIMRKFCSIAKPEQIGQDLLAFLRTNRYLNDNFFEVVCKSDIGVQRIAEYLNLFDPNQFSAKYCELIDELALDNHVDFAIIRTLIENEYYFTPLLYCVKNNMLTEFNEIELNTDYIMGDCEKINENHPQTITTIRNFLYRTKGLKVLKALYFTPYPLISSVEIEGFDRTGEAINLIDTTQIDLTNYSLLLESLYENNFTAEELVHLFEWLFDETVNDDCITDLVLKKSIFDSLDFTALNMKCLSEVQRTKIHTLMSDVCINNNAKDALALLYKYGCLIPVLEESIGADNRLDIEYSETISKLDEFSSYTLKWLDKTYLRCGLSEQLCKTLFAVGDFINYIVGTCLRENNMILDERIPFENYIQVYKNVDEMFELMSGHWDFLEKLQETVDFSDLDEKHLVPIFAVPQTKRLFAYVLGSAMKIAIKEKYLREFGKFKTENDSKEFQVLVCQPENISLLGSYALYYRVREQLWESNPTHKMVFTKKWNGRWKQELGEA